MQRHWMVIPIAAMVLAMAACSSDKATSTDLAVKPTTTPPAAAVAESAKESYIAQATVICADMNAQAAELARRFQSGEQSPAAAAALIREQAQIIQSTVGELRALPRPAGDEATLDATYDAADEVPPAAIAAADALDRGDAAEADRLGALADQITRAANKAADAYGLIECGSGSNASAV